MTKYAKLLWLDLEMTGLDANTDRILEVAAIATDWNFKELGTYDVVVHQSDETLKTMNAWCIAQHGASGLTERVRESTISDKAAEAGLLKFIEEHFSATKPVLLAGNSIHMDRRFIVSHWPELDARLHYRMLDVSAWKLVFEGKYRNKFSKAEDHRALADIRGSIQELQYYLGKLKNH